MNVSIPNLEEFNRALQSFARDKVPDEVRKITILVASEAFRRVVLKTPVDTGRARGNWQVGIGSPKTNALKRRDRTGTATIRAGTAAIGRVKPFDNVFISNNVPYIDVLESGLFEPRNPGPSRDPRPGRRGRVLVQDGYSIQAPRGMIAVTFAELMSIFP